MFSPLFIISIVGLLLIGGLTFRKALLSGEDIPVGSGCLLVLVIIFLEALLAISIIKEFGAASPLFVYVIGPIVALPLAPFIAAVIANFFTEVIFKNFIRSEGKIKVEKDYSLAKSLEVRGKLTAAVEEYRKIIAEDPKDIMAQFNLVEIYHHKFKNYEEALNIYNQLLKIKIEDNLRVFILNQIVDIFDVTKQYENAKESLGEIIRRYPRTRFAQQAKSRLAKFKELF